MGGEDGHADKGEDSCRQLDHCPTSCSPIVARNLVRDWFQIRSNMNCMSAVPVLLQPVKRPFVSGCFRRPRKMVSSGRLAGTE